MFETDSLDRSTALYPSVSKSIPQSSAGLNIAEHQS